MYRDSLNILYLWTPCKLYILEHLLYCIYIGTPYYCIHLETLYIVYIGTPCIMYVSGQPEYFILMDTLYTVYIGTPCNVGGEEWLLDSLSLIVL